jgi:hypothetical protein
LDVKSLTLAVTMSVLVASFFVFACSSDDDGDNGGTGPGPTPSMGKEEAVYMTSAVCGMNMMGVQATNYAQMGKGWVEPDTTIPGCPAIELDMSSLPDTMIITMMYGEDGEGCVGADDVFRSGSIDMVFVYGDEEITIEFVYNDFYDADILIDGTMSMTSSFDSTFTMTANMTGTDSTGTCTQIFTETFEVYPNGDVHITGGGTFSCEEGETITSDITEDLVYMAGSQCPYPESGLIEWSDGTTVVTVDFDTGECNTVLISINGETAEVVAMY